MSPRTAITLVFLLNGVVLGTWGSRIPAIQDRLIADSGEDQTAIYTGNVTPEYYSQITGPIE